MARQSIKSILKSLFIEHKGEILSAAELQAAIGEDRTEWARRVRELKQEEGWPVRLVIDHHEAFAHGGPDDDENLRVLCQECNSGAKDLAPQPPTWKSLMSHVRKAKREDQLRVLEQLEKKFRRRDQ